MLNVYCSDSSLAAPALAAGKRDGPPRPPVLTGEPPTISGIAQEGHVLTASTVGWSGATPATTTTTRSIAAGIGKDLRVLVTATNAGGKQCDERGDGGSAAGAPQSTAAPTIRCR